MNKEQKELLKNLKAKRRTLKNELYKWRHLTEKHNSIIDKVTDLSKRITTIYNNNSKGIKRGEKTYTHTTVKGHTKKYSWVCSNCNRVFYSKEKAKSCFENICGKNI